MVNVPYIEHAGYEIVVKVIFKEIPDEGEKGCSGQVTWWSLTRHGTDAIQQKTYVIGKGERSPVKRTQWFSDLLASFVQKESKRNNNIYESQTTFCILAQP